MNPPVYVDARSENAPLFMGELELELRQEQGISPEFFIKYPHLVPKADYWPKVEFQNKS